MKKTIKKVLDELQKDKPDLSYIRGLLEGLVDEEVQPLPPALNPGAIWTGSYQPVSMGAGGVPTLTSSMDESAILDNIAKVNLEKVKNLALNE